MLIPPVSLCIREIVGSEKPPLLFLSLRLSFRERALAGHACLVACLVACLLACLLACFRCLHALPTAAEKEDGIAFTTTTAVIQLKLQQNYI